MVENNILVIEASHNDLGSLVEVIKSTFPHDFELEGKFSYELCRDLFTRAIEDPNEMIYVAKQDKDVVGFCYYINKPPTNGTVILEMMGVRKDLQRKGIGKKLLTEADNKIVQYIQKIGINNLATIHLTVSEDNEVARKLYDKCGYIHVGDIPGFVGEGNKELVMLKKVSDI